MVAAVGKEDTHNTRPVGAQLAAVPIITLAPSTTQQTGLGQGGVLSSRLVLRIEGLAGAEHVRRFGSCPARQSLGMIA